MRAEVKEGAEKGESGEHRTGGASAVRGSAGERFGRESVAGRGVGEDWGSRYQ